MLRKARASDMGALISMARSFYAQSDYGGHFDASRAEETWANVLAAADTNGVWMYDDASGVIWYEIYQSPVSDDLLASERILWVDPAKRGTGQGKALISQYEADAKARGARMASVSRHANNEAAGAFYERAGWTVSDVLYAKAF